jgi:hypothetical protein
LIIFSTFPKIAPYNKFFVLISIHEVNLRGFFINSKPSPLSSKRTPHGKEIQKMQIEVPKGIYDFLSNPISYIDCSKDNKHSFKDFYNMLIESPSKICGKLNKDHLKLIDDAIKSSKLYSKKDQNILLYEFDFKYKA